MYFVFVGKYFILPDLFRLPFRFVDFFKPRFTWLLSVGVFDLLVLFSVPVPVVIVDALPLEVSSSYNLTITVKQNIVKLQVILQTMSLFRILLLTVPSDTTSICPSASLLTWLFAFFVSFIFFRCYLQHDALLN